jgi:hypothetical protein
MSTSNRREALCKLLRGALQIAGAAVVASSVVEAAQASVIESSGTLQARADRLAASQDATDDVEDPCNFANGAFRNAAFRNGGGGGGGGAFRKGGFANGGGGGGGFRNGGFANGGGGGGFRNGAFRNY